MRLAALLAAGLLLLAVACAESKGQEQTGRYTNDEVNWIRRYASWAERYDAAIARVDATYQDVIGGRSDLGDLGSALGPLRRCAPELRAHPGRPPTQRLRAAFDLLLAACDQDERLALSMIRSFGPTRGQDAAMAEADRQGRALSDRAALSIERNLIANHALPVRGGFVTTSRVEPRLSRVASKLAQRDVEIRCWSYAEWGRATREWEAYSGETDLAGFVSGPDEANIAPDYCSELASLPYGIRRPTEGPSLVELADSVGVLAHETEHLVDTVGSEADTECHAVQDVRRVARELGASSAYANRLADAYWTVLYPENLREYRTPHCRSGGLLDLNPDSNVWP